MSKYHLDVLPVVHRRISQTRRRSDTAGCAECVWRRLRQRVVQLVNTRIGVPQIGILRPGRVAKYLVPTHFIQLSLLP